ncbi:MAG: beta-galactosidase [Asgard group archaeon]|nr:beta-galactosidase [Asgard group archaeon]
MSEEINWSKKDATLQTPWFDKVTHEKPFPEYPRPQLTREKWMNLNGLWNYKITSRNVKNVDNFEGKILVPFPLESPLSGVKRQLYPKQRLWYQRTFTIPKDWYNGRIILHFGAVDWECEVWLNDLEVGQHKGGYTPFSFEITDQLNLTSENKLTIIVFDPSEKGKQPSGKQWLKPNIVFYTTISGIWQTVWLESVPKNYIGSIKITPDFDSNILYLSTIINLSTTEKNPDDFHILAKILDNKKTIIEISGNIDSEIKIDLPPLIEWSPENPKLYDLEISLMSSNQTLDVIGSYFAMRKFSIEPDSKGVTRFHLNNKPYFMLGLLDQGYWPDGLYTAPTDEALRWDIELTKDYGFNTIRKHLKVEPARWYHYCDKLGVLVWQDMINGGGKIGIIPQFLFYSMGMTFKDTRCYWKSGQGNKNRRDNFERELMELINSLYNVPSICIWVPFNEAWGQFDSLRINNWLKDCDTTRLVDHASGWFDQGGGDFISVHNYKDSFKMPEKFDYRAVILSETGGYTLMIPDHSWNPKKKYGYKKIHSEDELESCYENLVNTILLPSKNEGLSGVIYTQTTDVEIEYNGLVTYDRKYKKMVAAKIKALNQKLIK